MVGEQLVSPSIVVVCRKEKYGGLVVVSLTEKASILLQFIDI
jgi:hypothetical protein